MAKFGGNNNRRVQRGGPSRGPRPQGGFKQRRGGDRPQGGNRGGAGFRRGGDEGPRRGGFRRGGAVRRGGPRRGGPQGGGRGGKPRDHSALDEDMLQYWDKAGVKDKRDEEKAIQKAKLDRELEEYNKSAEAAAGATATV